MAKQNFLATDAQVATLAREYVQSADGTARASGTYLQYLLAHTQAELAKSPHKRHTQADSVGALAAAHARLYAVVVEATVTPDVVADPDATKDERDRRTKERNRRTVFARTSKADLTAFIKAGGRLATLTPATVTRDELRRFARAARAGPATLPDRVTAAAERLQTLVRQLAEEDAAAAREAVDELSTELSAIVTPPKQMRGTRKVGNITLHAEQ